MRCLCCQPLDSRKRALLQNVPPFTHEAQRWIWDRQNPDPRNCSRQKYYLGDNIKKQVLAPGKPPYVRAYQQTLHMAGALFLLWPQVIICRVELAAAPRKACSDPRRFACAQLFIRR